MGRHHSRSPSPDRKRPRYDDSDRHSSRRSKDDYSSSSHRSSRHRDSEDREKRRRDDYSPEDSRHDRHSHSRRDRDKDRSTREEERSRSSRDDRRKDRDSHREERRVSKEPASDPVPKSLAVEASLPPPPPAPALQPPPVSVPDVPEPAVETPEQKKQRDMREKRERLEAWKAQKAAKASMTNGATSPASVTQPVNGAAKPTMKPASTVTARLGLPVKPVTSKGGLQSTVHKLPAKPPASLAPDAPIAFSGTFLGGMRSSLPTNTSNRAKAANFMGGEEEDDAAQASAMFKPDELPATEEVAQEPATHQDDDSDDEDLLGDDEGDERARAEEMREKAMMEANAAADAAAEDADGDVNMEESSKAAGVGKKSKKQAMDVDTAPQVDVLPDDEEVDPLEAYMQEVNQEVKKVNAEDSTRVVSMADPTRQHAVKVSSTDVGGVLEDEDDPEKGEIDASNLTTAEILALAAKKAKKKDVATIDHSKIQYDTIRKAFYHPLPEIEEMSEDDANLLRLTLDGIKIRGIDCPKPITKWSLCGLPAVVLDVIKGLNYASPTPIQAQAIPAVMSGRDLIGVAKTGSGKTIAFLLPMFRHIKDQRPLEPLEGPIAMIMTPTRELATQIFKECKPFLKVLNLRASCLYGGSPLKDNIAELKRGVEIVVCTPGRMLELLATNSGKIISMRRISYLVLDEADRMFDMGFEPQVTKITQQIRPDRQTVLFSATFPKQMEALARKILKKPLEVVVGGRSVVAPEVEQIVEVREEDTKFHRLLEILGRVSNEDPDGLTLVFVDRQEGADDLLKELMNHHYVCQSIHGGKEQVDRDQTIADFKAGVVPIVIATSVAARGLDVKQLKFVINYDAPNHMEDYVHRAGRTGRAGNKGVCYTFITPDQDKYAVDLLRALEASGVPAPEALKEMSGDFLDKVKTGKTGMAGSGFGGKGLDKFDKEREATRKAERTAYGGEDEAKAEEEEAEPEQKALELKVEIRRGPAPDTSRPGLTVAPPDQKTVEALARAEKEAAKTGKTLDPLDRIKLIQANLNASLRTRKMDHNLNYDESRMEGFGNDFHALVPINDYPQKARWKVTNKETMAGLVEATGASITNKGIYYPPGKDPEGADPPKLYLLIEANDEGKVRSAITELKRLLLEASTQALEAESRGGTTGRYTV